MTEQELCSILGKNIKRFRNLYKMSQESLAEKIDVSTNFLSDIETGKSWLSPKTLVKLAAVLQTRPGDLLQTDDIPPATDDFVSKCTHEALFAVKQSIENLEQYFLLKERLNDSA
jgi:transcriptional regulator with XRE-family HTH domain